MSTAHPASQPLLEALIAGVGVKSQSLGIKCTAALRAAGGQAVAHLLAAAKASPRRRKSMETLAATIGESQGIDPAAAGLCLEALLVAATVQTTQDNPSLIPAIQSLGPAIVGNLINVAIINLKRPATCLRVLHVIQQLGDLNHANTWMEMSILQYSKSQAVRELAGKLEGRIWPMLQLLKSAY